VLGSSAAFAGCCAVLCCAVSGPATSVTKDLHVKLSSGMHRQTRQQSEHMLWLLLLLPPPAGGRVRDPYAAHSSRRPVCSHVVATAGQHGQQP
jgi:hypothetical protein